MRRGLKTRELVIVPHTHWDREWYQTFQDFRVRLVSLGDHLLDLMEREERYPYFSFDGQTIVLEDYLEIRPENTDRLKSLVQSGRVLVGPWYILPDEFLVSGESYIRNLLRGHRIAESFGGVMKVGYLPDPFGHISQIPQILQGFGIDNFIFMRGLGDEADELGIEFRWAAPDGTEVLAIYQLGGYCNAASLGFTLRVINTGGLRPSKIQALRRVRALMDQMIPRSRTPYLLINNGCDHLEPQPQLPEIIDYINAHVKGTHAVHGTFVDFIDKVRNARPKLPVWSKELRGAKEQFLLAGVFSARTYLKQANAATQTLLEKWLEPVSTFAWIEGAEYPGAFIEEAWKYTLQNHPHDSICGCSIDQVHDEMMPRFAQAQQISEHFTRTGLDFLAGRVNTASAPEQSVPLVVFNPLGGERQDVVRTALSLPVDWNEETAPALALSDSEGMEIQCQLILREKRQERQSQSLPWLDHIAVAFPAELPSCGYATYYLTPAQTPVAPKPLVQVGDNWLENEQLRVDVNADGSLRVTDKRSGRVLDGCNVFEDVEDIGDEYNYSHAPESRTLTTRGARARVSKVLGGPVIGTLKVELDFELPASIGADRRARSRETVVCPISSLVSLSAGVARVDIWTEVSNLARDHRLRVMAPTGIMAESVQAEGHFDVVERFVDLPDGAGWSEPPSPTNHQNGFVDVSDGSNGAMVVTNGFPEYEAVKSDDGITLAVTLLRCVGWLSRDDMLIRRRHAGPGIATPGAQCLGTHRFEYAIVPHDGSLVTSQAHRLAHWHNVPARAVVTGRHKGTLAPIQSLVDIKGDSIVLSAVKRAETGRGLIVRFYNTHHQSSTAIVKLAWPIRRASLARLDETRVKTVEVSEDGGVSLDVPGGRIITLRLEV